MVFQGGLLVNREIRSYSQLDGDRMIQKGGFNDQVIYRTVKACFIILIGLTMVQGQVGVRVMGSQGMDQDLRCNAESEEYQHDTCQKRFYGAMFCQAVFCYKVANYRFLFIKDIWCWAYF